MTPVYQSHIISLKHPQAPPPRKCEAACVEQSFANGRVPSARLRFSTSAACPAWLGDPTWGSYSAVALCLTTRQRSNRNLALLHAEDGVSGRELQLSIPLPFRMACVCPHIRLPCPCPCLETGPKEDKVTGSRD